MNSWFILYQSAKDALRLVQKIGGDKQSKTYLKSAVFLALLPAYLCFFKVFFFDVDHVEWNRMPFDF